MYLISCSTFDCGPGVAVRTPLAIVVRFAAGYVSATQYQQNALRGGPKCHFWQCPSMHLNFCIIPEHPDRTF